MQSFDVIVIGTGSAGKTVAETVREAGKSVAIIDKLPFGGTCSQRGCDPKKVLVGAAELVARTSQLVGKGISATATINWPDLIKFKKTFTDPIPEKTEQKFVEQDIHFFHGTATFLSERSIRVGDDELQANHIVLANGLRPQPLNIPGEELLLDSTGFMELAELPRDIVMVGGGYIAFEFAHIAARAGANVTILHQGKRPLEGFDKDLVEQLVEAMRAIGIFIVLEATVKAVAGEDGNLTVQYERAGQTNHLATGLVVHAAGRVADVTDMALDKAGVEKGEKGIKVNEFLQSVSNPAVYACGDVADKGLPLTPLASYEGRIVAKNIVDGNKETYENKAVPSAVFTVPTLASIGLTEEQARNEGRNVKIMYQKTADWYVSRRINESFSGFKILIDQESDQIVGAHLLSTGSDDLINIFALAINHQIPAKALRSMLWAYPSHASDMSSMLET
jgi:glutathione reductase (NADPH)